MFENLKAELTRKNMKYKDLAEKADINIVTLRQKINGKSEFNLSEILKVIQVFHNNFSFEYLFGENITTKKRFLSREFAKQ